MLFQPHRLRTAQGGINTGKFTKVAEPSPSSSAEVKNRIELYLYSPQGPSWRMKGETYLNSTNASYVYSTEKVTSLV